MSSLVRTVMGDIPARGLGRTDMHETLLRRAPLRAQEALDEVDLSTMEARDLRTAGIESTVELTPPGLGRRPGGLAAVAHSSDLTVIAATGTHREDQYPPGHWIRGLDVDGLAELLAADITHGCAEEDGEPAHAPGPDPNLVVRAGVIRLGFGYWRMTPLERRFLQAAADAQRATGAAVICQLTAGSAAMEVVTALTDAGVAPDRIALSRIDHVPDSVVHAEIAGAGAYLCYTGAGHQVWPDSTLLECLLAVVERGHASRILVGGARGGRSRHVAYGGMPGLAYLPRRFLPRLRSAAGSAVTDTILERNPARLLSLADPA